jgi:uncharacterized membrane protein YphA (DoxX/SURF4 family)
MTPLALRTALRAVASASPPAPLPSPDAPAAPPAPQPWGVARRLAFRFAFAYWVLYLTTTRLGLGSLYGRLSHAFVPWAGKHLLRLPHDVTIVANNGSGDTTYDYVNTLCQAAFAAAVALAWSALDRRPRAHPRLREGLRVYARYSLALAMLEYGLVKVMPMQFSSLGLAELTQTYGESSPMGLLWRFMGYSRGYQIFAGAAEVIGGLLLLFQRTTALGALVVAGVMANVVALNFCYDVPVKLYSSHLFVLACVLLAPDARRLARFFVLGRPADAPALRPPPRAPWARRARVALKALFLAFAAWQVVDIVRWADQRSAFGAGDDVADLRGLYEVEQVARGGVELPAADGKRWRTAVFDRERALGVSLRRNDGEVDSFFVQADLKAGTLALQPPDAPPGVDLPPYAVLRYERPDEAHLTLEGAFEGAPLSLRLRRLPEPKSLLLTRGFHWVNERPFGR